MSLHEANRLPGFIDSFYGTPVNSSEIVEVVLLSGGACNSKLTAVEVGSDYTEVPRQGIRHAYHWAGLTAGGRRVFQPGVLAPKEEVSPYIYACPSCSMRDALEGALASCPVCRIHCLQIALISSYLKGRSDMVAAVCDLVPLEMTNLTGTQVHTIVEQANQKVLEPDEIRAKVDPFA